MPTDRKLTTSSVLKIIMVMHRNHVKHTNINCGTEQSEFGVLTAVSAADSCQCNRQLLVQQTAVSAAGGWQYFALLWKTAEGHTRLNSKSSQKEIITHYMLIFVTGDCSHSCPLQCRNNIVLNISISYEICLPSIIAQHSADSAY